MLNPEAESTIFQGITTEVVGNCGGSEAPVTAEAIRLGHAGSGFATGDPTPCTFAEHLEHIEKMGTSNNMAWLVGHNSIRYGAGITGEIPSKEQLEKMRILLEEALDAGAVGFSTGLEFDPGRICKTEEIAYLLQTVKKYDGIHASHIRNRANHVYEALDEFLDLIRGCGVRGEVSHMNIRYNTGAPENAFENCVGKIEKARSDGFDILADMTPLNYGIGGAGAILPTWFKKMAKAEALSLLSTDQGREKVRNDTDRYWRFIYNGEWERVRVQNNAAYPEANGKSFPELAEKWKKSPWDCYFDIIQRTIELDKKIGKIVLVARLFTDEHLKETISHPLYSLGVDGYSTTIREPLAGKTAFPLHYMGMAHFIAHHVREIHTLTLEDAIRKMTSMPANHFGLRQRGLLKDGYFADVVVFDYDKLKTLSTFEKPAVYTEGVEHVFVNGIHTLKDGVHTGARSGRTIRR